MKWRRYSRLLATYPYVVAGVVSGVSLVCIIVILTSSPPFDFSDPKLGFETRGTVLSNRAHVYEQLLDTTLTDFTNSRKYTLHHTSSSSSSSSSATTGRALKYGASAATNGTDAQVRYHGLGTDGSSDDIEDGNAEAEEWDDDASGTMPDDDHFFCDMPRAEYGRIVFRSSSSSSNSGNGADDGGPGTLWNATKLRAMCRVQQRRVRARVPFRSVCVRAARSGRCCRSWSLGAYVALLTDKPSCGHITDADVSWVQGVLNECIEFYQDGSLADDCWSLVEAGDDGGYNGVDSGRCNVPMKCKRYNAVYNILHYFADRNFMKKSSRGVRSEELRYSAVFLPIARSLATEALYKDMIESEEAGIEEEEVEIVAIDFGLKQQMFEFYLKKDIVWIFLAIGVVWLLMWLYTASLFLTFMTMLSIVFSLAIAYFIYTMVFNIAFFPFMNLLAIVILLGIGVDDVFIYSRVWTMAKLEKNVGTLEKVISDTLRHAALSMFVTSFTTAAAFYANYISDITALKCFGVYTGTAILVNFIMMLTWIPAAIVIQDKWCSDCCLCYSYHSLAHRNGTIYSLLKIPAKLYTRAQDYTRIFFEKILACLVIKLRILWILLFAVLGACSIVVVLFYPKMKLPTSNEFQVFAATHPFEVYDLQMKDQFWFEKVFRDSTGTMPITIVWGAKPVDKGDHLDPLSKGKIEYDDSFSMSSPEAQTWLRSLCLSIRSLNVYQAESGPQLSNCFIENFKIFMERECTGMMGENLEPCCASSPFPYLPEVFDRCLALWIPMLTNSKRIYPSTNPLAGPRYSLETGASKALIVEFNSKVPFSFNFKDMGEFYRVVNAMIEEKVLEAPPEMQGAWFTSHLDFYDLQASISSGTPYAIGISLAIATAVAFVTTLNVLVTLYAMASISLSIFATIALLVLLGWELNILESVTISVAVGLSIDFTLHYGMAYRLSPDLDKTMRINCATSRQGTPIAMAALTTFLAGAVMMPSTILAYRQLGTFLMLVMIVSWLYSNFFFLALLKTIGPEGGFGQFHWPSCYCCQDNEHVDKTVYTMSDSNISRANSTEMHELEPLAVPVVSEPRRRSTSNGSIKRTSEASFPSRPTDLTPASSVKDEEEEEEEDEEHVTLLGNDNNDDNDDNREQSIILLPDESNREHSTLLASESEKVESNAQLNTDNSNAAVWIQNPVVKSL